MAAVFNRYGFEMPFDPESIVEIAGTFNPETGMVEFGVRDAETTVIAQVRPHDLGPVLVAIAQRCAMSVIWLEHQEALRNAEEERKRGNAGLN